MAIKLNGIENVSGGTTQNPVAAAVKRMKYADGKRTDVFLGTAITVALPRKGYATATILVKGKDVAITQDEIDEACMGDTPIMAEFKNVQVEIDTDFRTNKIAVRGTADDVVLHRGDFFLPAGDDDILMTSKK